MATANVDGVRRGRGRPAVYTGEVETKIVSLLKQTGSATETRKILKTENWVKTKAGQERVSVRVAIGFVKHVNISMPTLLNLAARNGVELQVGRPPFVKAA